MVIVWVTAHEENTTCGYLTDDPGLIQGQFSRLPPNQIGLTVCLG